MKGDSPCVNDATVDLRSSQVYTYCGNCKGVRDLIDRHNELKRSYEACLRLNEILAQKVLSLESRSSSHGQDEALATPQPWNEEEERSSFLRFMARISQSVPRNTIPNAALESHRGKSSLPEVNSMLGGRSGSLSPRSPRYNQCSMNG